MNKVNYGTKYTHRVTLRLNDEQFEFLQKIANIFGVSPSDYLRMNLNTQLVATKKGIDELVDGNVLNDVLKGKVGTHEDVKTNIDNNV